MKCCEPLSCCRFYLRRSPVKPRNRSASWRIRLSPSLITHVLVAGTFDKEKIKHFGEENPMGRAGQPVECAPAFVFLASSDSTFVTGQTLHVDGGQFTSS